MFAFLRNPDQRNLGLMFAFGSLLCNGSYNALAKGLTPWLSPASLLIISEALMAFFVIITFGAVPLLRQLAKLDMKTVGVCVLIGLLNSGLAPLLWFKGLSMTTAVNASVLSPTGLVTTLMFSSWLLGERVSRTQILGAFIILAGIVIINFGGVATFRVNPGDVIIVLATQLFALGSVLFKKYLTHIMPELAIAVRNVAGICGVLIASSVFQGSLTISDMSAFPMHLVSLLLAFVFFSRYLNLSFYYEALDRLPATTVSLIDIAAPLSGMAFAVLLLNESIPAQALFGGTFIVIGLLLEQLSQSSIERLQARHWPLHLWHRSHPMQQLALQANKQA